MEDKVGFCNKEMRIERMTDMMRNGFITVAPIEDKIMHETVTLHASLKHLPVETIRRIFVEF